MIYFIISSVVIGVIIALFTGIFPHSEIVGANWWGYPLVWLTQAVLSPGYSPPLNVIWLNLIIDIVVWSVIVFLFLFVVFRKKLLKKGTK